LEKAVENQVFVGIDVPKVRLDVALRPSDESFDVANNQRGIATLVKRLEKLRVGRIVLEASGGYEVAAAGELAAAGLPVAVVNPRQVRDFARATGRLAKTDANLSSSWISLATVTPSLVTVGAPKLFSNTTLRPLGPSVTVTASAKRLTPLSIFSRAPLRKAEHFGGHNYICLSY
jgi:Transposase